ncbi:calpastatin L homeolog [Xenopus laevis]|uniref:Calpastatin n=1 Tax=Xenopus laevis TaxID=8355 RepID=Q9I9C1_XENLA|nr:calpastatin L homeolog [Xenopus laevis]CAB48419.1 putative calpastatin [Xenopus laevis]
MTDADLVDEFSRDFELSCSPPIQTMPTVKPKETPKGDKAKPEVVVASSASAVKAAAAPSAAAGMDSALDELLGTLEGPDVTVPESPVYTGPEVMETSTSEYREELGKREGSIPPAYRHLLDGKVDGKVAPPPPPEEEPMTDDQLIDEFSMDFSCSESSPKEQAPAVEPKVSSKDKKAEAEVVAASSAAVKAAPTPSKAPAPSADPLDALAGTLGVRKEDPSDKKPTVDKVKEGTPGKEKKEKFGEDERTIHPDRRLKEVKDKDGKPLLPKPEESPKPMSEADLLDALTEGFVTSPATPAAPLQSSLKKGPGSEDVVSCSKASAVKSGAPQPAASDIEIPEDAQDLLAGSLGQREVDPDENKLAVDLVKGYGLCSMV